MSCCSCASATENPPPPLYDDVVDAIAESAPDSYRPWTKQTANRIGYIAGALALVIAAVTVLMTGPLFGGSHARRRDHRGRRRRSCASRSAR